LVYVTLILLQKDEQDQSFTNPSKMRLFKRSSIFQFIRLLAKFVKKLFASASDKENPDEIKTEADKTGSGGESRNLFDAGHHLGDPVEDPQPRKNQGYSPDNLNLVYLFIAHQTT
jgi:hypothetical protein